MEEIINWLLEDSNPSVKYYTIKNILGEKFNWQAENKLKKHILQSEQVKKILSLRDRAGWWISDNYSFNPLYKSTFWQVYFLSVLGATRELKAIDRSVRLCVKNMQSETGSFPSRERYTGNLICIQGLALEMFLRLGYEQEEFTSSLIDFITGIVFRNDFRCKYRGQLKCPWGAIKVLKAFNLIPERLRNPVITSTINKAIKFLIRYDIVEANYPRKKTRSPHWSLFGFPSGIRSDILELTGALVDSGCEKKNSNLKNALKYIYAKKDKDGFWKMEHSLNGKMLVDIERKNKPSKWVTYFALKTLLKSDYVRFKKPGD